MVPHNARRRGILLFLSLVLSPYVIRVHARDIEFEETCKLALKTYIDTHNDKPAQNPGTNSPKDPFLFFMHIPRTAGSTYSKCFIHSIIKPSRRCIASQDAPLHLNLSLPNDCTTFSSHDDYSLTDSLPLDAAVITLLRKPVDRVISAYEFAVKTALSGMTMADAEFQEFLHSSLDDVDTVNGWPWSHLVQYFREDIKTRVKNLKEKNVIDSDNISDAAEFFKKSLAKSNRTSFNFYHNPFVIPLNNWIHTFSAHDFIHEATPLQLLGITNTSHWSSETDLTFTLRDCFFNDKATRDVLSKLAESRLRTSISHVGLAEKLDESMLSLAAFLNVKMTDTAWEWAPPRSAYAHDPPGVDLSKSVRWSYFNPEMNSPASVTETLGEARARFYKDSIKVKTMKEEVKQLEKEVQSLQAFNKITNLSQLKAHVNMVNWHWTKSTWLKPLHPLIKHLLIGLQDVGLLRRHRHSKNNTPTTATTPGPHADAIARFQAAINELKEDIQLITVALDAMEQQVPNVRPSSSLNNLKKKNQRQQQPSQSHQGRPGKLILTDEDYLAKDPIGKSYQRCVQTEKKAHGGKIDNNNNLKKFDYSDVIDVSTNTQRMQIDRSTLKAIMEMNEVDQHLWEVGSRLLEERMKEQRNAGVLESLPSLD